MNRNDVTEMIVAAKIRKGLQWAEVARQVGASKEWVTAACLGQMGTRLDPVSPYPRNGRLPGADGLQ